MTQNPMGPTWSLISGPTRLFAVLIATLGLLASCGGGVGTGGTGIGSYTVGSITGFGSVIVNQVRYDDSSAMVQDEDGRSRSNSELRLGMRVEVEGDTISTDGSGSRSARASSIRISSELLGAVQAVDLANRRLTVLGQTVQLVADTVVDDSLVGGLAGLAVGTVLEVHAQYDEASLSYLASRIERASGFSAFRLRGVVTAIDPTARTLRIGQATVLWSAAGSVPADLAVGRIVRLQLATQVDAAGRWIAQAFGTALRSPPDRPQAEIKGLITAFTSARQFSVGGVLVDAAQATFPDGTAGLRLGARVEVKGRAEAGRLIAVSVELESDGKIQERGFEFKGPISALDSANQTITVRGQLISTARSELRFDNGTRADLRVNREVEVKATTASPGGRLEATRITFK